MDKAMCKRTIAVYQAQPGCNKPVWFKSNTVHVWLPMFGWFLGPMSGRTYHTSWSSGHRAIGQTTTNHKLGISYRMAPHSCKWVYKPWNIKTSSWNIYHKHHGFFATVKALYASRNQRGPLNPVEIGWGSPRKARLHRPRSRMAWDRLPKYQRKHRMGPPGLVPRKHSSWNNSG